MSDAPKKVRRLLDLDVHEVSIVDRPAIRRQFLILKRLEDEVKKAVWTSAYVNNLPDSSFLYVEDGGKKDEEGKTVPRSLRHFPVKDDAGKADLAHLRNALARIPQSNVPQAAKDKAIAEARRMLSNAKEKAEIPSDVLEACRTVLEYLTGGPVDDQQVQEALASVASTNGGQDMSNDPTQMDEAAKKKAEEEEAAKKKAVEEEAQKAKGPGGPGGAGPSKPAPQAGDAPGMEEPMAGREKRQKSLDGGDEPAMVITRSGQLVPLMKGQSKLMDTEKSRALSEAAEKVVRTLKETDEDAYKGLMSKLNKEMPADPSFASQTKPTGEGPNPPTKVTTAKSEDDPVLAALSRIEKRFDGVESRVESIEKGRNPSSALPNDGDNKPSTPVQKGKSFWGSVL